MKSSLRSTISAKKDSPIAMPPGAKPNCSSANASNACSGNDLKSFRPIAIISFARQAKRKPPTALPQSETLCTPWRTRSWNSKGSSRRRSSFRKPKRYIPQPPRRYGWFNQPHKRQSRHLPTLRQRHKHHRHRNLQYLIRRPLPRHRTDQPRLQPLSR